MQQNSAPRGSAQVRRKKIPNTWYLVPGTTVMFAASPLCLYICHHQNLNSSTCICTCMFSVHCVPIPYPLDPNEMAALFRCHEMIFWNVSDCRAPCPKCSGIASCDRCKRTGRVFDLFYSSSSRNIEHVDLVLFDLCMELIQPWPRQRAFVLQILQTFLVPARLA